MKHEDLRTFYADSYLAQNPDLDAADSPQKSALLSEVCRLGGVTRAPSLLEVGCGAGALLADMKGRLHSERVIGVDYSGAIAGVAQKIGGHIVTRAEGAALPFKDRSFDLAYFADVLEHVLAPESFLRELARVSRYVAFLIPLEAGILATPIYVSRRLRGKSTNYEQYGHIWRWNRKGASRVIDRSGLRLLAYRYYPSPERPEAFNRTGAAVERVRGFAQSVSPAAAEALFGASSFVGLAASQA